MRALEFGERKMLLERYGRLIFPPTRGTETLPMLSPRQVGNALIGTIGVLDLLEKYRIAKEAAK